MCTVKHCPVPCDFECASGGGAVVKRLTRDPVSEGSNTAAVKYIIFEAFKYIST